MPNTPRHGAAAAKHHVMFVAPPVFAQAAVDAWVIWDPFYAASQPVLLKAILEQVVDTDHWAEAHQNEAAAILAPSLKLPLPVIPTALSRIGYGAGPMTAEAAADQQRIADTFSGLHLIPSAVTVRDALWQPPG